ncbi:ferritin-like domain-containing protein [Alteromonas pelagimontana]|uniref:Ferritin-like domain-containing protein n=1 Tax=Alteromonas pelagimontana TaxID=1858656 RepID=A0A6M4MCV9_9ALTE|nr:ferritin-like domain-containing protein [Alteromonas pelagimontana]QJR81011.1 ferritin-like domain-containing protein [Alteromonas pelagimontana]
MEQTTKLGANKTGIDTSPEDSKKMIEGANGSVGDLRGTNDGADLKSFSKFYLENAEPLGSVPMPATFKGMAKSTLKMVTGHHPQVFVNKLGERLAYERAGVRMYEQLIIKCRHAAEKGLTEIEVPLEKLEEFRNEEQEHFEMLKHCLEKLGCDPTAQTPDADASAVASSGIMKVIVDPRTSVSQSLQAILALELTDNAAWDLLVKLAKDMGMGDMAKKFEHALAQEDDHVKHVRQWYEKSIRMQD